MAVEGPLAKPHPSDLLDLLGPKSLRNAAEHARNLRRALAKPPPSELLDVLDPKSLRNAAAPSRNLRPRGHAATRKPVHGLALSRLQQIPRGSPVHVVATAPDNALLAKGQLAPN